MHKINYYSKWAKSKIFTINIYIKVYILKQTKHMQCNTGVSSYKGKMIKNIVILYLESQNGSLETVQNHYEGETYCIRLR